MKGMYFLILPALLISGLVAWTLRDLGVVKSELRVKGKKPLQEEKFKELESIEKIESTKEAEYTKELEHKEKLGHRQELEHKEKLGKEDRRVRNDWGLFFVLLVPLFVRSVVFYGFNTFLALYWIENLGQTKMAGSVALGMLFMVGAFGTLIGGRLSDSYGFAKTIKYSYMVMPFLVIAFAFVNQLWLAYLLLIPIGLLIFIPQSPMVVLSQKYLPRNVGLASGVSLGLSVSVGGIVAPLLGKLGDAYGLTVVIIVMGLIAMSTIVPTFFLKEGPWTESI